MSVKAASPIVVPLVFGQGRRYEIKSYSSRMAITSHDDFDGWGRSWSLSERSSISTSRANHVQDVHISTVLAEGDVAVPTDAVEVSRDVTVGLVWGEDVSARRRIRDDETVIALDFGGRTVATWQHLEGSGLWFGSDINGHLASIVATCATRKPRDLLVSFRGDRVYEAALYGDRGFDVHASEPFDEDEQVAMHEQWLDRDENDSAPSCRRSGIRVESEDGDADLSVDTDGAFSYFDFNGTQTFGTVSPPPTAERVDRIEVKTSWPTTLALRADCKVQDEPKVAARFGNLEASRWVQLGDEGPWLGVSGDGYLAEMILTDVRWQSQGMDDDEDMFDRYSPERFEAMMAEQEARQDKALAKISFPVYGLAGDWDRERTAQLDDDGPTPRSASVELTYGTQKDMSLPYVEVKTSNEPWRVAELRKGKVNEFAFESLGWLSHLTRFPIEVEHSSRAEAAEWFAEGRRQEQELSQRPWDERTLDVDGEPHTFHVLQHKHGWIARGVAGDLAVDVRVLHLAIDEVALETVPDLLPFIQGRKDQFAKAAQMRQKWASVEDNVPTWAKDARREAQRACRWVLSGLMDNEIQRILDATSASVMERRGGRDGYSSLLSLYIGARGFRGYGGPSKTWTNSDGSLVSMVATMTLVPEHGDDHGGIMVNSSMSSSNEPDWWGLSDQDVFAQAMSAAGASEALDEELPVPLVFRREGDVYKLVSDIVEKFEEKLGDPASIVKPKQP